jgi:hypothetical protein
LDSCIAQQNDTSSTYSPVDVCTEILTEVGMVAALDGQHCFKGNFLVPGEFKVVI